MQSTPKSSLRLTLDPQTKLERLALAVAREQAREQRRRERLKVQPVRDARRLRAD